MFVVIIYLDEVVSRIDLYVDIVKKYFKDLIFVLVLKIMFLFIDVLDVIIDLFKVKWKLIVN